MSDLENLEFNGTTIRNKQYCIVGKPLNWRDGDNVDLLISNEINDDFMVLIKGFEQYTDLGVNFFHQSIDDDSKATDSGGEENNDENAPKTPYDGCNMNTSSYDEGNNDEDDPETPYDGENMNDYSNNQENNGEIAPNPPKNDKIINADYYEVTFDTPTNVGNNETIDND